MPRATADNVFIGTKVRIKVCTAHDMPTENFELLTSCARQCHSFTEVTGTVTYIEETNKRITVEWPALNKPNKKSKWTFTDKNSVYFANGELMRESNPNSIYFYTEDHTVEDTKAFITSGSYHLDYDDWVEDTCKQVKIRAASWWKRNKQEWPWNKEMDVVARDGYYKVFWKQIHPQKLNVK